MKSASLPPFHSQSCYLSRCDCTSRAIASLNPVSTGEAQKAVGEGEANITRAQAAIYLTKILYNGKNKEGREEALKAGIIEIAIK